MQPERQIAVACVLIGGALIYPDAMEMLKRHDSVPGGLYFTGGVLGSLGVFFGSLLAFDFDGGMRILFGGIWLTLALAFAGAMFLAMLHSPGWTWRILFAAAGVLPPLTYGFIGWRTGRAGR